MNRLIAVVVISLLLCMPVAAQVQTPEQFLGYSLGSQFTPHHQVVRYFEHLQQAAPENIRYEQYGKTYEGRPLTVAYISSAANIAGLEKIRQQNIALSGISGEKISPVNQPVLVWLSYNVHGNEASSTEAAMLTAYELLNPANARTRNWLNNTLVILDPCLNPDGRDRYVNWFNSIRGKHANPVPVAREHSEPWPGGRMNHYHFDLNRDWAWQTQVETQHRMKLYNRWLPQIHVDFHEQGINNPYYFAPAAEPFHEVITDWQREFQTAIGRNNARYFDQQGWLYFTRERFDLFYPSYGDTYPTYKGAIGMTYEQAGHSRAGTAIITADGDTLTLYDRLLHHHTTGLSTIEISSENASKLLTEFERYYSNAVNQPRGEYKAYLIKADAGDKLARLIKLLDVNDIRWQYAKPGGLSGFSYFSRKSEKFQAGAGDIIINAAQPHGNLVQVLFERQSGLSDSATYDITAWSLPYAFGLETYGLAQPMSGTGNNNNAVKATIPAETNSYAYAVKWNGLHSARFLASLLKQKIKDRFAEEAFSIGTNNFEKGTLLITRTGNAAQRDLPQVVSAAAEAAGVEYIPLATGFADKGFDLGSDRVKLINAPRIGLVAGDRVSALGMGEIWHFFDQQLEYPLTVIWANELSRQVLAELDVLILPDGNMQVFSNKDMNETLKGWVSGGGKIIALENMVSQLASADWGLKRKGADEKKDDKPKDNKEADYSLLRRYENRERDYLPNFNPGSIYRVELDNSHPLAYGYNDEYYTLKQDAAIYDFMKGGWNVGIIRRDNHVAGFTGSLAKEKLNDGLVFGVIDSGRGSVVLLADNPLFRSFWENGKLLFCNALFMVGN